MKSCVCRVPVGVASLLSLGCVLGAQPVVARALQEPDQGLPVFGVESSLVLLDVVVRDKGQRLVRDLTAADFEIEEDGRPQAVAAFEIVNHEVGPGGVRAAAAGPAPAPDVLQDAAQRPAPGPPVSTVIAFVFDRLSPEARERAHKAARVYAEKGWVPGDLVGVFRIDQSLRPLLPFSRDPQRIRAAFERAATLGHNAGTRDEPDSTAGAAPAIGTERSLADVSARMTQTFDWLERDQQGFAGANGLLAVVAGLRTLPGRKTIVFFAEGLRMSAHAQSQLESVAALANRVNVSLYTIDTGGLRVDSGMQVARDELMQAGDRRVDPMNRQAMSKPLTTGLERHEELLRTNPQSKLNELARSTGGFAVSDTNDASDGFRRIQEDMRFYYLLSYAPANATFDGTFRSVSVKVKRSGCRVFARNGYLALPPSSLAAMSLPVRTSEGRPLSLLDRAPLADDFPLWIRALTFPEPQRRGRVPILAALPLADLTFTPDDKRQFWLANFSVLARIRDARGLEVERLSQHYPVKLPAEKLEAARQGEVLFFREADLAPGRYTLDVIAHDTEGQRSSVRTARFEVPRVRPGGLALSSVTLLKRIEQLAADEVGRDNPFYQGQSFLYPGLGEPLSKSQRPSAALTFTVYPAGAGGVAPRQATVEVWKDGQSLLSTPTSLAAPDGQGRIQHAVTLPLATLAPGAYTLRVTVQSGAESVSQEASLVVAP